jgi:hypothetical protein
MIIALARQELSRTQQAGLLARAALTVAAGRMGGRPPQPILEGEDALQAEIIEETRRRLKIASDDGSDEALRAIEDMLDAEMEAVAEPVDVDAALGRALAMMTRIAQTAEVRVENAATSNPAAAALPEGEPAVSASSLDLPPLAVAAESPETSWHPPLPPQERFQEWARLRAPVRERPPSLFERVTATFGRKRLERPRQHDPAVAEENAASNAGDRENATKKGVR